ncbi:putative CoA-binding protein [Clavibacter michiganensis]|nr:putative CoA-binding protein [Clavibacter michiganensis]MDQ0411683.1 putative CoA-binding protein [Clavibacter michiganensis]
MSFDTGGVPPERTGSTPHPAPDAADLAPLDPAEETADRAAGDAAEAQDADTDAATPTEPVSDPDADGTQTTQLQNGLTCAIPRSSPLAALLRSERTWTGPTAKERQAILRRAKSVAIVGASPNPARSSYFVGTYLQQSSDYRVYFVNPNATEILGQKAYPDLASLPEVPDIVDVFRKASDIPSVVDDVVAVGAPVIWVQLGIWNQEAAEDAEARGLTVVMDRCVKVEHARFHGGLHLLGFDTGVISARKAAV